MNKRHMDMTYVNYDPQICTKCQAEVPFLFGADKLCRACIEAQEDKHAALDDFEQLLIEKEDRIADLQTIISLTKTMNERVLQRLELTNAVLGQ